MNPDASKRRGHFQLYCLRGEMCCLRIFVIFSLVATTWAMYDPDEVINLPGMSFTPNYRQWSGYLKASSGKFLHYWFVTSQRDPLADPVVLWLNGGPGCSSLDGFLSENGPFHVNDDGATLYKNEFSWNRIANMLYLESPAGVGYSYSDDKQYATNDDQVAEDNYLALQSFFTKFPNFTQNEFFIFGESYGGIYAPTLSLQIALGGKLKVNFQGFAVGNGIGSFALNDQSLIYFGYYHGLFGEELWKDLNENCCKDGVCNFYNNSEEHCSVSVAQAFGIVYSSGLNEYALYLDCAGGFRSHRSYERTMLHLYKNYREHWKISNLTENHPIVGVVPPCINSTAQMNWLNRGDVRKALHIPDILPPWDICSDVVGSHYQILYSTVKIVYEKLLALGLRALVYNGDTDMACNFLGDQWFVEQLGQKPTVKYQHWLFEDQIAGFYQQMGNITFLTVKGAGHMVPQWAPGPAFHLFQSFLSNSPY
ncbi:lysosomal protective protein [Electrophorus electricus]|uniref:Carboxypeptidase n=1 Tax=Electrophorus electricus TaxID=8005 RepID=A0A4W4DS34_ELEEL|nr:lysosomal protective protein [Electrophorus electricus]XP_035389371.1 lysosomal protective protein [Electrophorus electricus]XP_035389378.1 lysosomal protective protein [Electrophorus electricus]